MRVVFMGSSSASVECLRALQREKIFDIVGIVTQPDRPVGRGKVLMPSPLAQYAQKAGFTEIIKPESVNAEDPMARIRAWRPDVIAVVAYGQILRKPLLDLPMLGCINCHFSLLPKYRGAAPVIAAILDGERRTGVTVMRMGEKLDDGPILAQRYEPIYEDTTGGDLMGLLAIAGGVTLAKTLRLLWSNALPPPMLQDEESATYVKKLKKTDGLIDWNSTALELERKIRAYSPWPCCYTFLPEHLRKRGTLGRLHVLFSRFVVPEPAWEGAAPGTVVKLTRDGPIVKCGDTALLLRSVKPEGGKAMSGEGFLCSRKFVPMVDRFLMA